MIDADTFAANLEAAEQSVLRKLAQENARTTGPKQYYGPEDTFDRIGEGIVVRRNNAVKALVVPSDGAYGLEPMPTPKKRRGATPMDALPPVFTPNGLDG